MKCRIEFSRLFDDFRAIRSVQVSGHETPCLESEIRFHSPRCASAVGKLRHRVDPCFSSIVWLFNGGLSSRSKKGLFRLCPQFGKDLTVRAWKGLVEP